ncbi:hypothetical protein GE09DRAFT_1097222 [Coniochaeta sp. 2T2.1]|nr:hypothetical protein GE09DRAFT_1097222 [Coniochaeta sp. 2T2.1]
MYMRCVVRRRLLRGGVSVTVAHEDVLVAVGGRALGIVVGVAVVAAPSADTDVQLAVGKGTNPFLQFGEVLGGVDPDDLAVAHVDAVLELVPGVLAGLGPGVVHVLHEVRIALASLIIPHLLDYHVTTCTAYHANIEEVVAAEAVLCDFCLLPNLTRRAMQGYDRSSLGLGL